MFRKLVFENAARADEQQAALEMTCSHQRPGNDAGGRLIAAHRVDGDTHG
jgi:hypothetical protein